MSQCKQDMLDAGATVVPRTCPVHGIRRCRPVVAPPLAPAAETPWLQTIHPVKAFRRFDLVHPTPAMVNFDAMAMVLARLPRFGGHTEGDEIYSVAQHTVEGVEAILRDTGRRDWAAAFLLHDGHEYIIGDFTTPIQEALMMIANRATLTNLGGRTVKDAIKSLKSSVDAAIYPAAGLPWPLNAETHAIVKEYDLRMGRTERDERMDEPPCPWNDVYTNAVPVVGCDLKPWSKMFAQAMFKGLCLDLLPALGGNATYESRLRD